MDQLLEIPENHLSEEPMLESLPVPKKRGRPKGSVTKPNPQAHSRDAIRTRTS